MSSLPLESATLAKGTLAKAAKAVSWRRAGWGWVADGLQGAFRRFDGLLLERKARFKDPFTCTQP